MTNPIINPQPNYSGVTIQIANPAVYAGAYSQFQDKNIPQIQNGYVTNPQEIQQGIQNPALTAGIYGNALPQMQGNIPQAYPPQYYLNNYNYQNNGLDEKARLAELQEELTNNSGLKQKEDIQNIKDALSDINDAQNAQAKTIDEIQEAQSNQNSSSQAVNPSDKSGRYDKVKSGYEEQDFTKSRNIINNLDEREAEIEAEKKNSKQKRVVALTDDYIKSLENYLNNPNDEIRLMAAKEILTRLDEDKNRYDDAALNALLNKMLQDPSKLIRISSLSAFASQLASGNDYTVTLLQNIQANPNADKEDVLQAADILLKMSGGTEIRNIPNPAAKQEVSGGKQQ